jgi:dTDP-4-amino-4,6-dideoxygalactose transaminase
MSWASRTVVGLTATERNVRLRRANFLELLDGIKDVSAVSSLFKRLPDDVVPYMFPLLIKDSDKLFAELKCAGVPIWRWDSMTIWGGSEFVCPNSEHYSQHLLQLPCHQELRRDEIDWMISTIKARAA